MSVAAESPVMAERLQVAEDVNAFISQMSRYDASLLAPKRVKHDAAPVLALIDFLENLEDENERRFFAASREMTDSAISSLLGRIVGVAVGNVGDVYIAPGGETHEGLRSRLMGMSLAIQASHMVDKYDEYPVQLQDALLGHWRYMDDWLEETIHHPLAKSALHPSRV